MNVLGAALFHIAINSQPAIPPKGIAPELPEARIVRIGTWSEAVEIVANGDRMAMAVIDVIHFDESRNAAWVHDGRVKGDCKHGVCKATCLGSIWPWAPDWHQLAGVDLESTIRCTQRTLQAFQSGIAKCAGGVTNRRDRLALGFEAYRIGHCGTPSKQSMDRAAWTLTVEARLWMVPLQEVR